MHFESVDLRVPSPFALPLMVRRFSAICAMLVATAAPAFADLRLIEGTITRVSDGDTVWLQPDDRARAPIRLRLQGIDAPERCQAWGERSRAALAERVLRRRVAVSTGRNVDDGR